MFCGPRAVLVRRLTNVSEDAFRLEVVPRLVVDGVDADRIKDDVKSFAVFDIEITFQDGRQVLAPVVDCDIRVEAGYEVLRGWRGRGDDVCAVGFRNLNSVSSHTTTASVDEDSLSSAVFQAASLDERLVGGQASKWERGTFSE
jgi:hypothetical protein